MDATSDAEGARGLDDRERDHQLKPEPEEDLKEFDLLIVCVVVALLLVLFIVVSVSVLCLYRHHRLNWFQNATIEAETDRLRSQTSGTSQTSTSAAEAPPIDGNKNSNGEQTGSRFIPKFLFSSSRSTNHSVTGSGYGTIPTGIYSSGIGFPVPTKVSYVLLSNKSVDSPESTPTSPDVDSGRPSNEPNTRFRHHNILTGNQPRTSPLIPPVSAAPSRRLKVMGTQASRGSNPNAPPATVASSPCRIVVDAAVTSDEPSSLSDLNSKFVDSAAAGAAGTAESRRSSYSSFAGSAAGDGAESASRRGSISPRERSSVPFLWTLGPSNSAPSVAKEDSFWVPANVLLKKRANSLAPPSLTITADVESSSHNGIDFTFSSRIEYTLPTVSM